MSTILLQLRGKMYLQLQILQHQKEVFRIHFFVGFVHRSSHQMCSVQKVFSKISQNSPENTCARVSFLIKLQAWPTTLLKKRLWNRCFPVNFATFLRTSLLGKHLFWLTASNFTLLNHFMLLVCYYAP